MTKTLLIGAHTQGIGDAFAELWIQEDQGYLGNGLVAPRRDDLDVTDAASIRDYLGKHGPFDEIVYSAGVQELCWVHGITESHLDKIFQVNVFGFILVVSDHIDLYPEGPLRVAVVVSDASDKPMRTSTAYCASKAALAMSVRTMARELAPGAIIVGVSPGVVEDTGMTRQLDAEIPGVRNWTKEQARAYENSGSVLGRRIEQDEVAETLMFALRGPEGLNGSIITINGGN
jgi:NAD(P)-dependent dehydrogenase (short-subunit alcohol dehydrogenase family)